MNTQEIKEKHVSRLFQVCEQLRTEADRLEKQDGDGRQSARIEWLHDRADNLEMALWAFQDGSANRLDLHVVSKAIALYCV